MLNANAPKKFTSSNDKDAEMLLERVLLEIKDSLSNLDICVLLGGSYGRGDGGVRLDKENGILYNDLDFFVFAKKANPNAQNVLHSVAKKYEKELSIDVDFSKIMTVKDIKNNASRLMMQELKRGYVLVYGEDLLEKYLPQIPANKIPFSEACRLLVNRGMGLLLAGEKISQNSQDIDFILRNLNKAILGAGDALLIANNLYAWKLNERVAIINSLDINPNYKDLYKKAVQFKSSPNRTIQEDMPLFWNSVRDFYRFSLLACSQANNEKDLLSCIYKECIKGNEYSIKNWIKYSVKTRSLPFNNWKNYTLPGVVLLLPQIALQLDEMPQNLPKDGKLYSHWLLFN